MSRTVTLNRVVDPVGDLLYREETTTENFMVKLPCTYDDDVDVEYDYSDSKIDKVIFTVTKSSDDGYDNWKTSSGETTSKKEVVYELWFNHVEDYRVTCDYWDSVEYETFSIYTIYAEDFPEDDCDDDCKDECEKSKDASKSESNLDQYDSYWSIEKKTVDGKTTYGVTVKTNKGNVQKSDLTVDQYQDLINSLHSVNVKEAMEKSVKKDDAKDAHDSYEDYCRKNGIGGDSIWKDFDKIVDSVFRKNYNNPVRDFYKDYFLK